MKMLVVMPAASGVMYTPEMEERRVKTMLSYSAPDTEIVVDFPARAAAASVLQGRALTHMLIGERLIQGEREGYDACIPFGMIDYGVAIARAQCTIPIVGQAQATYAMASMIAERVGGIFYRSNLLNWASHQARTYGVADRVVGFGAVNMETSEFPARRQELYDRFVSEGKRLVKDGAEIILCLGMSMSPVEFSAKEYSEGIGVPVLEGMGCAVAMAHAWHRLGTPWPFGHV